MPVANHVEVLSRLALQFIEVQEGGRVSFIQGGGLILGESGIQWSRASFISLRHTP